MVHLDTSFCIQKLWLLASTVSPPGAFPYPIPCQLTDQLAEALWEWDPSNSPGDSTEQPLLKHELFEGGKPALLTAMSPEHHAVLAQEVSQ